MTQEESIFVRGRDKIGISAPADIQCHCGKISQSLEQSVSDVAFKSQIIIIIASSPMLMTVKFRDASYLMSHTEKGWLYPGIVPCWLTFNYSGLSAFGAVIDIIQWSQDLHHDQRQLQVPQSVPGVGGHLPHVDGRRLLSRAAEPSRQRSKWEQSVLVPILLRLLAIPTNHNQATHAAGNSSGDLHHILAKSEIFHMIDFFVIRDVSIIYFYI